MIGPILGETIKLVVGGIMKKQSVKFELADMLESSCELKQPDAIILIGIYQATAGRPCDDCGFKNNCKARHDLENKAKIGYVPKSKMVKKQTNFEFSVFNKIFKQACKLAHIKITTRQASKYRMKKGAAFKYAAKARILYAKENK